MRCHVCEKNLRRSQAYFGDEGTPLEGKPLCEECYYDDEPCTTIFYGKDDTPYIISETRNETDGEFRVRWHSTDPWRGYYEPYSSQTV